MEIENGQIKKRSLLALKGCRVKSVLWVIAVILSWGLTLFVSDVLGSVLPKELSLLISFFIYLFFFLEILFYAVGWYYEKVSLKSVNMPAPFKVLCFSLNLAVRAFGYAVLFFFVPAVFWAFSLAVKNGRLPAISPILLLCLDVLVLALTAVFAVWYAFFLTRYFTAPFLLMENGAQKIRHIIKDSVKMMKPEREKTMGFLFSLLGYLLPSLFVLPILYFGPKAIASISIYAKYIIEKNRMLESALPYNF